MTTQAFSSPSFVKLPLTSAGTCGVRAQASQPAPHLATSSADADVESLPMELSDLGVHADRCKRSQGSWFALRCAADAVHGFVAARVITTLVVFGLLIGISSLII